MPLGSPQRACWVTGSSSWTGCVLGGVWEGSRDMTMLLVVCDRFGGCVAAETYREAEAEAEADQERDHGSSTRFWGTPIWVAIALTYPLIS